MSSKSSTNNFNGGISQQTNHNDLDSEQQGGQSVIQTFIGLGQFVYNHLGNMKEIIGLTKLLHYTRACLQFSYQVDGNSDLYHYNGLHKVHKADNSSSVQQCKHTQNIPTYHTIIV